MKKQFVVKLAALALALTMLPVAAVAASTIGTTAAGKRAYSYGGGDPVATPAPSTSTGSGNTTTTPSTPAPVKPEVVETIEDVATATNEDGQTVVTATVEVKSSTAPVEVSEKAVDALVKKAAEGDAVVIVAETTGAVTVSSEKLAELVEKTGNPVAVGNTVAAVEVNTELVKMADGANVKIEPVTNKDGTISVPVMAGDKEIKPEDVKGGINVQVPVQFPTSQVKGVFGVRSGKTDVKLKWSVQGSGLKINLTISASIRITR